MAILAGIVRQLEIAGWPIHRDSPLPHIIPSSAIRLDGLSQAKASGVTLRTLTEEVCSMRRSLILAGLLAWLVPVGALAQQHHKTVTVEVYWPPGARLFI